MSINPLQDNQRGVNDVQSIGSTVANVFSVDTNYSESQVAPRVEGFILSTEYYPRSFATNFKAEHMLLR